MSLANLVAHLTMTHNLFGGFVANSINAPLWTMAVDAQFYLALPIVAWCIVTWFPQRNRLRTIVGLCAFAISLSVVWRLGVIHFMKYDEGSMFVWQRGVIGMGMCFALGGLVALSQATGVRIKRTQGFIVLASGLGFAVAMLVLGAWLTLGPFWEFAMDVLGALSVSSLIFGALHAKSALLDRIVSSRVAATLADHSYSIYLVHYPVIVTSYVLLERTHLQPDALRFRAALIAIFLVLVPILAIALHRWVEKPFLSIKETLRETSIVPAE